MEEERRNLNLANLKKNHTKVGEKEEKKGKGGFFGRSPKRKLGLNIISSKRNLFQDCQLATGKQIQLAVSPSEIIMAGNATASGEFNHFFDIVPQKL